MHTQTLSQVELKLARDKFVSRIEIFLNLKKLNFFIDFFLIFK
jgi:hypothetical protein